MITHSKVSKLYRFIGDGPFDNIMMTIDAHQENGDESFDLEVHRIDEEQKISLIEALEVMGYIVTYEKGEEVFYVNAD